MIIQAQQVSIDYRLKKVWHNVIHDVTVEIAPKTIHGLVGESGSGKSTLAMAMMRYLAPNARIHTGTIHFDGQDITHASPVEMRRLWGNQMNLVPQDPLASLNPAYSIGDQIAEIARQHDRVSRHAALDKAVMMLQRVKIADPADVIKRYPHQLSGGMRQRVLIAMALMTQPRFLVLDEPTTALDVTTQAVILDLFRELIKDNQAAALYVSHDLGTVAQLCDVVTVLYGGEVMESAPVLDLFQKPLHPYTAGLLMSLPRHTEATDARLKTIDGVAPLLTERPQACVFAPRCAFALDDCHTQKPPLEHTPDGRMVRCWRWQDVASGNLILDTPPAQASKPIQASERIPILQVRRVFKKFGTRTLWERLTAQPPNPVRAVDDVSITVRAKTTFGLVGESGSGKTTLARVIVGLEPADYGQMALFDVIIQNDLASRAPETLKEIRMVFQNPNDTLNPYQSVGQALRRTLMLLDRHCTREELDQRVIDLLASVRLTPDYAQRYPSELSGGEKQRVAIARAFAANPSLILLDEPTSALDVSVQAVVLNLLKDLRAGKEVAYVLISHDLDVVAYLAEWIAVMYLGQIVEEGPTAQVYQPPFHPYTEALISAIPQPDPAQRGAAIHLEGDIPSARRIPGGCRFHTRCPRKIGTICEQVEPPWRSVTAGHAIRCHIPIDELITLQIHDE
ncbi:MAG: peptide ABC transporter ATP-binding protein [Phototrophicales bacterium]|nr:MAG: peptide ABC transporter ATP-binding protein [Phototrophicales bacterium]RMG74445.1 MAG: ABC transporter ATP-binding protein [Chloroflexota bacterium]